MRRCVLKFLAKPKILLILSGILFVCSTLNMLSIPLPQNRLLVKITQNFMSKQLLKKDWYDYEAMYKDAQRVGLGEQGKSAILSGDVDRQLESKFYRKFGFNGLLSDVISVNRSVLVVPEEACLSKRYLSKLPEVSVVMPFHNEYFSVLIRSVHSLINRTPPELLKEIILIDDFSELAELSTQLDDYVAKHFPKVQIVRLRQRMGLIRARLAGARKATAEVMVIFDSHIEVNHNWLPPLLEPIALDKRTAVCPFVDNIRHSNFEYVPMLKGLLGGFDWLFHYTQTHLSPDDSLDKSKPYKNPVMIGGLFAISVDFFWELGGYDEGLDIWGAEQFELSFKIWMCGGQILDVPCSRVAHLYRGIADTPPNPRKVDFLLKNKKRVAEVWMDEYKHYIYEHGDGKYEHIDAGDLSVQKTLREKLQCKSFKWFLEEIAPHIIQENPPVEPPEYAYGAIQNFGSPNLCVDMLNKPHNSKAGLYPCARNLTHPQDNQKFALTWRRDLRMRRTKTCLDVWDHNKNGAVWQKGCHGHGGNQFWYYDRNNKWLVHGQNGGYCLEASPTNMELLVNICQKNNRNMQWNFGFVNDTALDRFFENIK